MSVSIVNLTDRPVTLQFNNKQALHIGPKFELKNVADSRIAGNRLISKLAKRKIIEVKKSGSKPVAKDSPEKGQEAGAETEKAEVKSTEKKPVEKKSAEKKQSKS